jgi:hypothetical protein
MTESPGKWTAHMSYHFSKTVNLSMDNSALGEIASEVRARLQRVIAQL